MVKGALIFAQTFVKHKLDHDAAFMNIGSSATQIGPVPGFSSYTGSKMAITKSTEYFASENKDVRVVNVPPGTIRSNMSEGRLKIRD